MHIEFSTFNSLINGYYDEYIIAAIDKKKWSELWEEYLTEVKRFNSIQKKNVFGNELLSFNEIDLTNKDSLTGYDKKLIGEFIRRHHARLAQEIAFGGLLGVDNQKIEFGNFNLNTLLKQLTGILARSHGLNVRDTFIYLEEIANQGWRNPDDINIVFLMVVLRISDYIQIDDTRVNQQLLKLKTFTSPISQKEHRTHLAITSISFNQPDTERIFVIANPSNSEMLVKLKSLFADIQNEFDLSWAILGEIYGFLPAKRPYIKFRRIISNISDNLFLEKLAFVPLKIRFEVSTELSKLLVGPLYGNSPTFGIRELLQNAVDACIERNFIEKKQLADYKPAIIISIDRISESQSILKIVDNGKGMSLNEIIYYFLSVGTSFRKSLSWKKEFVDDQGKSLINRNGKFGIGVLAAFLLGDEITVETKHYKEQFLYSFKTKIDNEFIEINKLTEADNRTGTTISLLISNEKRKELLDNKEKVWTEWFVYNFPKIEYFLDGKQIFNKFVIDRKSMNCFETTDFKSIEWAYIDTKKNSSINNISHNRDSFVVCNGIVVTKNLEHKKATFKSDIITDDNGDTHLNPFVIQKKPSLLIEDKDGVFPIKLDRNDIDCIELPFEEELLVEVSKKFIAEILTLTIEIDGEIKNHSKCHNSKLIFSKYGYSFDFDYFIGRLKEDYEFVRIITADSTISSNFLDLDKCFILPVLNEKIRLSYQEYNVAPYSKSRILLKTKNYEELFESEKKRISTWAKYNHAIEFRNNEFVIYNYLKYSKPTIIFKDLTYFKPQVLIGIESIQEIDSSFFRLKGGDILNSLLSKYIGSNVIIPFEMHNRKEAYKKAFQDLKRFMPLSVQA